MSALLELGSSLLSSSLRGWRGTMITRPVQRQPALPLALYEFEADAQCRLLREALTELDLDALIYPCPEGGARFGGGLKASGHAALPTLVDANSGAAWCGSVDIIEQLASRYGAALSPARGLQRQAGLLSGRLASSVRGGRGRQARSSRAPALPLELFSFESSPYSRRVREVLCELQLPYLLRNTGKARWSDLGPPVVRDRLLKAAKATGHNRKRLLDLTGRVQVPYLIDANTGAALFESAAIVDYLERQYAN